MQIPQSKKKDLESANANCATKKKKQMKSTNAYCASKKKSGKAQFKFRNCALVCAYTSSVYDQVLLYHLDNTRYAKTSLGSSFSIRKVQIWTAGRQLSSHEIDATCSSMKLRGGFDCCFEIICCQN